MPTPETAGLTMAAVVWMKSGYDNDGNPTVKAPVEICCRSEKTVTELTDNQTGKVSAQLTLFVDRRIPVGSEVWIGTLRSLPVDPDPVYVVVDSREVPDIKGREVQRTLTLQRK